jgi:hypothetical protein
MVLNSTVDTSAFLKERKQMFVWLNAKSKTCVERYKIQYWNFDLERKKKSYKAIFMHVDQNWSFDLEGKKKI